MDGRRVTVEYVVFEWFLKMNRTRKISLVFCLFLLRSLPFVCGLVFSCPIGFTFAHRSHATLREYDLNVIHFEASKTCVPWPSQGSSLLWYFLCGFFRNSFVAFAVPRNSNREIRDRHLTSILQLFIV